MLKNIGKLIIVVVFVYLVYLTGKNIGKQIKNEPRYTQPKVVNEPSKSNFKVIPQKIRLAKIDSRSSKELIEKTYKFIFDSLDLTNMSFGQLKQSDLLTVDASFINVMLDHNEKVLENSLDRRKKTLLLVGTLLQDTNEVKIMVKYLRDNDLWTRQTARNHYLLMQYPNDHIARKAYRLLLNEASKNDVLDFFFEIKFLYRRAGDEYFDTDRKTIEKLDAEMLLLLKDKVDDYSWWAAYPEKDACDAIDDILSNKK
ncbi:MAG: hypothetical protein SNJ77_09060 [Cytophagales bacterium]